MAIHLVVRLDLVKNLNMFLQGSLALGYALGADGQFDIVLQGFAGFGLGHIGLRAALRSGQIGRNLSQYCR
jgi:hypothetical protein